MNRFTATIIALLSLLFAACSGDDFHSEQPASLALSPTVAFTLGDTRGVPVDSLRQMKDFRADAYLHRDGSSTPYFHKQRQYGQNADGVYRSDNAYFWPYQTGDKMAFVALAPWTVAQGLTISEQGDFTYTVPSHAKDQQDLLFAAEWNVECPQLQGENVAMREPVPLHFRHILTQVRFVFGPRLADFYRHLTVHLVTVENIAATGTWNAAEGTWQDIGPQTNSFQITASDQTDGPGNGRRPYGDTELPMWNKEYTMFLMPQTLPTGARVAVDMSHRATSATDADIERKTYYVYLDGKQLLPGHTVIVEVNANFTSDCRVVNLDGSDVELRPLPALAQTTTFNVMWSGGAGSIQITLAPECTAYASLSTDLQPTPSTDPHDLASQFTIHTTDNTSPSDRFIRLILTQGHDPLNQNSHLVVLKQRGMATYGSFTDDPAYPDTPQPWGYNWPTPLTVELNYDALFEALLDYGDLQQYISNWASRQGNLITFNYTTLRTLARTPNSPSDGLTNTVNIHSACHFLHPFSALYYLRDIGSYSNMFNVNGEEMSDQQFNNAYQNYAPNAVAEALTRNNVQDIQGYQTLRYLETTAITHYLPAIEQLETIAQSDGNPLVPGRTYWSSTIDNDGEPIALQINADGSYTRTKPGADTPAYVHPVHDVGQ